MGEKNKNILGKIGVQKLLAPLALLILYLFFSIFGNQFFTMATFISILDRTYYIALLAFGITFVIITAGIDLSIGTVMMCAALLGGYLYNVVGLDLVTSMIMVVLIATLFGLLNGVLISKLKLPPFIATLGVMMMSQGLGSIITNVQTQRWPTAFDPDGWYKSIFYKTQSSPTLPNGFPTGMIFIGVMFVVAYILLNKTKFGRYTFAIGSNEEAVRLSGVDVAKWKMTVYTVCGFFVGLAAIVYSATYSTIIPGTGNGEEMKAIASVIIGGTTLSGGVGTMSGTLIGALLMSVLGTGLMSMGLPQQYQTFFTGFVVILAVLLDLYRSQKLKIRK